MVKTYCFISCNQPKAIVLSFTIAVNYSDNDMSTMYQTHAHSRHYAKRVTYLSQIITTNQHSRCRWPHFLGEVKRNFTCPLLSILTTLFLCWHVMFMIVIFNRYMLKMFPNSLNSFPLVKYDD